MRAIKYFTLLIFSFLLPFFGFGQKYANNWFFGYYASMNFDAGSPTAMTNSAMYAWGGSASMSDTNGSLLFYTNGSNIYNKKHQLMQNGSGLMGDYAYGNYGQSVIAVPRPGSNTTYYVFSINRNNSATGYPDALRYSTVITTLNSGDGGVTNRNYIVATKTFDAKITSVKHKNGVDYWVITHEASTSKFYAFLVTSAGVSTTPVVSNVGRLISFPFSYYYWWSGNLKASPDGTKIASTYQHYWVYTSDSVACELFDFNNSTGVLSNSTELVLNKGTYTYYWSSCPIEFSPDGSKLYLGDHANYYPSGMFDLYQFDLKAGNAAAIQNSRTKIFTNNNNWYWWYSGALQLAPDGKIYVARYYSQYLGVINAPNHKGEGCCYNDSALYLKGKQTMNGLPQFITSWFYKQDFTFKNVCFGDTAKFIPSNTSCLDSLVWNFGDANSGTNNKSKTINAFHVFSASGKFKVSLTSYRSGIPNKSEYEIEIYPRATPKLYINDTSQCFNGNYFVFKDSSALNGATITKKKWDLGDNTAFQKLISDTIHEYNAIDTFKVKLVLISDKGCSDSIIRKVLVNPEPTAMFDINDTIQCFNGNNFIFTDKSKVAYGSFVYNWSFGDTNISYDKSPKYSYYKHDTFEVRLIAGTLMGCVDTAYRTIFVHPSPKATFTINDTSQCLYKNSFIFKDSSTIYKDKLYYKWNFGDGITYQRKDTNHTYTNPNTYQVKLIVTSSLNCPDSLIKTVYVHPEPKAKFSINDVDQCLRNNRFVFTNTSNVSSGSFNSFWKFGDSTTSTSINPVYNYSNDDTFRVDLKVVTDFGCKDSTFKTNIVVFPMPKADFVINDSDQCKNENSFTFTNSSKISSGKLSSLWDLGDSKSDTSWNTSNIYANPGNYVVRVITTSQNGCIDTIKKPVIVYPSPKVDFSIADTIQCFKGNQFSFSNNTTILSGSNNYLWTFGDNNSSTSANPIYSYLAEDTFFIQLKALSDKGCADSLVKTVYVLPSPQPKFSINNPSQCFEGNNFIFYNNTILSSGSATYVWDFGDSVYSTLHTPSHSYSYADTFTVNMVATSDLGCSDSLSKQTIIHVHEMPKASFTIVNNEQCLSGNSFMFNNVSSIKAGTLHYFWNWGDGDSSKIENPIHTFNSDDTFDVKLYAISDFNCIDSFSASAITYPMPKVDFTINTPEQCFSKNSFLFSESVNINSGSVKTYTWFTGDNNSYNGKSITHSYGFPDTFSVKLLTTSVLGCSDSTQKQVVVHPMPVPTFTIDNPAQCFLGNKVNLSDKSTISTGSISSLNWSFGDNSFGIGKTISHSYIFYDTFIIKLVATSGLNCTDSFSKTVDIYPMPVADFSVANASQCLFANSFSLTNLSTIPYGNIALHNWLTDDGNTFNSKDLTHSYLYHDSFNVNLIEESGHGCKDTFETTLIVHPMPNSSFSVNDTGQCFKGNSFVITNLSTIDHGTLTYNWNFDDGNEDTIADPVHTFIADKTYNLKLLATSDLGCIDSTILPLVVYPMPVAMFSYSKVCLEQNISFTDNSTINSPDLVYKWDWDFGDGISTQRDPVHVYTTSGYKNVLLKVSSNHACEDDTNMQVLVNPHVIASELVVATVVDNKEVYVQWKPSTIGIPMHYVLEKSLDGLNYTQLSKVDNTTFDYYDKSVNVVASSYYYQMKVVDSCDYESPYSNIGKTILLKIDNDQEFPVLTWNAYEQWPNDVLEYQINIFDDDNEADETIESVNNQTLEYTDKTTIKNQEYYCYHIAAVRNGNTDIKSISNTVCIPNILYAFLPNAFTPNEDGVNDYFEAKGKNIIEYEITIYNQWGMVMFHSTDINDSWDGKYNNHPCPTGVYAYSVKFFGSMGQNKVQAGTLHLIK